ncbi:TAP-like protein [Lentzea fradiae]|uniref:TAP-like protein n=1 Tax=Lentzea fradiae TaxID=200378 RepID=A0A1G7L3M0_9PSEU|nr:alpha/beta fold hydrolase [Lentzea fradiae]SDF44142.1 TAP-like protein [Lentzea fradiae]
MRTLAALAATALVFIPALVVPGTATATRGIDWGACTDQSFVEAGAECGHLSVPLDHDDPTGRQVQIAVSRVKHKVPSSQYQGVLVTVSGGPGGSGLPFTTLGSQVPGRAAEAYDWVSFDPRGVGASKPALSCDPGYMTHNRPHYVPRNQADEAAWLARTRKYAKDCGAKNDPALLANIKTTDNARDIDLIRAALGVRQVSLYAVSYGTYVAQVYSALFPSRVRRLVMDSSVDPRDVFYRINLNQNIAMNRNLRAWMDWVARYDSVYHLGATPSWVRQTYEAQLKKLAAAPAGGLVGPSEMADAFIPAEYSQASWTTVAEAFASLVAGDWNPVKELFEAVQGPGNDNGYAVYLATQCTDVRWPAKWEQWRADAWRTYRQAPDFTWLNTWYNAPCLDWPVQAGTPVNIDGTGVPSALLVVETEDGAEPFPGSIEVRKRFPGASLVALPGGTSHATTLSGNTCVDSKIADYLLSGALPARLQGDRPDTTCAPPPLPVPAGA